MNTELNNWKKQGKYFSHLGHNIFYQDNHEEKDPINQPCLVLIHGFPTSSWDWNLLWPKLSVYFRLITVDLLGFGFSDKPKDHTYTIEAQADMIEALLNHCAVQQYHMIAHDFGTLIAQEMLSRHQTQNNMVQTASLISLLAMSGSIFPELSNPRLIQKLLISKVGFLISRLMNRNKFYKNLSQVFSNSHPPEQETLETYWQLLTERDGHRLLHKICYFLVERANHGKRWAEAWQTAGIPIRYVVGTDDPMYGGDKFQRLSMLSKHKDVHEIQNAGHFPQLEATETTYKLILEFVQQHPIPKIQQGNA